MTKMAQVLTTVSVLSEEFSFDYCEDKDVLHTLEVFPDKFDLLIIGSNFEPLRTLRTNQQTIPVLALSPKDSIENKLQFFNLGGDDFLAVPFHHEELMARIEAVLQRYRFQSDDYLWLGDIKFNTNTRQTTISNSPVQLTERAQQILECLLRDPNRIISHASLLNYVWRLDSELGVEIVDANIYILQNSLKRSATTEIQKVRDLGYRIIQKQKQEKFS